jgi:hypothetical protein
MGKNDYLNEYSYFNPWILPNGLVTWIPEVRLHTKCVIKVKDFPFDSQCCEINFYSWAHSSNQMSVKQFANKNSTNLTHLTRSTEWIISDTYATHTLEKITEDLHWWITKYVIRIKRESIYYFYTLIMPCGVLSVLSILLFRLPPDSDEKITLGVTILLAFFVNSLIVADYTPEASAEIPVIGLYYTFNIIFVAISLTGSVFILNLHHRGHNIKKLPNWIKLTLGMKSFNKFRREIILNNNRLVSSELYNEYENEFKILKSKKVTSQEKQILVLLKLIKINFNKIENDKLKTALKQEIIIEWKEAAKRLEFIFFIISLITILSAPFLLFGRFYFLDFLNTNLNDTLTCDN